MSEVTLYSLDLAAMVRGDKLMMSTVSVVSRKKK